MKTKKYAGLIVAGVMASMASMADGVFTNYGDFAAASVNFNQVTESSVNTGITFPHYGTPMVSAASDAMDFNPVGFSAQASNGDSDLTDGNLVFEVEARENAVIEQVSFAERGTFNLGGAGTDNTYVDVTADFYVEITEVDNVSITPLGYFASMTFNPDSDGTRELVTDGAGSGIWTGNVVVDLNLLLFNNGWSSSARATKVSVDLDNILTAFSEEGTSSSIAKKDFDVAMSVEIIPEPASLLLVGVASSLAIFVRRRFIV